jgi:hypothetical protein
MLALTLHVCACCQVGEEFLRLQDDTWVVLDASQGIDDLHSQVTRRKGNSWKGVAGWAGQRVPACHYGR